MSEVTNLATRIALLQTQLSRNLAELAVAQRTAANSLVTGRLQDVIAQQEQELAQLPANIRLVACHELRVPELEGERHLLEFKHIQPE